MSWRSMLRALGLRAEVKTEAGPFTPAGPGPLLGWANSGSGATVWPAMARMDVNAAAGNLADNPAVSIGLSWIRRNAAKGRIVVGSEAAGEFDEDAAHPLTAVLRRPNPCDSWRSTIGGTTDSLKVDGNAYWLKARDGLAQVREVYWAPNHTIEVVPERDPALAAANGPIRGYWFSYYAFRRWYAPSEVVHFRDGRDPVRRWMGLSDLKRQVRSCASVSAAERYTTAVLINAHAGKIVMPRDGAVDSPRDEDEVDKVAQVIEVGLTAENAGRIHRSNLPVELADAGLGPEAMGLDRIADRPESYILAALGLNALVLGLPSSKDMATYANKGEARREAWENGVIPVQDLMAEEIEAQLLTDFGDAGGDAVWWDRRDVEALREDANERANRSVALFAGRVATRNEARAIVDLPAVPGGDGFPDDDGGAKPATPPSLDEAGTTPADPENRGDDSDAPDDQGDGAVKTLGGEVPAADEPRAEDGRWTSGASGPGAPPAEDAREANRRRNARIAQLLFEPYMEAHGMMGGKAPLIAAPEGLRQGDAGGAGPREVGRPAAAPPSPARPPAPAPRGPLPAPFRAAAPPAAGVLPSPDAREADPGYIPKYRAGALGQNVGETARALRARGIEATTDGYARQRNAMGAFYPAAREPIFVDFDGKARIDARNPAFDDPAGSSRGDRGASTRGPAHLVERAAGTALHLGSLGVERYANDIVKGPKFTPEQSAIASEVGRTAAGGRADFVAEAYAAQRLGKTLSPGARALYDELAGPDPKADPRSIPRFAEKPPLRGSAKLPPSLPPVAFRPGDRNGNLAAAAGAIRARGIGADPEGRTLRATTTPWGRNHVVAAYNPYTHVVDLNPDDDYWDDPAASSRGEFAAGRTSTDDPLHPVEHEAAHGLHRDALGLPAQRVVATSRFVAAEKKVAGRVSKYAATAPGEFVAEAFVGMRRGKAYPADVMALYRKFGGPTP